MADRAAFEALINAHLPAVYRYACWLCGNAAQADDLVQETMLRAWRSRSSLREAEAARAWLTQILRREYARSFERKQVPTVELTQAGEQDRGLWHEDRPEVDEMHRAMAALSPQFREPLILQVLMGFSTREIAELLDISNGAVLTRLHRARGELIKMLSDGNPMRTCDIVTNKRQ